MWNLIILGNAVPVFFCCRFITGSWLLFQFGSVPEFLRVFKLSWCHILCCWWLGSWLSLCWPRLRLGLIGDQQCLPNSEIVAQYLYLFSSIYLVTQNPRYILWLPHNIYKLTLGEDLILNFMEKTLLQPEFFISFSLQRYNNFVRK